MGALPIFFCGPHCSGKTSILKNLYNDGTISEAGFEIGKELFYQRGFKPDGQGEDFEREILEKELSRDAEFSNLSGVIGIESWHPGNLAYAAVRNPDCVPYLLKQIPNSTLLSSAYGICFNVSRENIYFRTQTFKDNREWAADFYTQIANNIKDFIDRLGLTARCVFIDANRPYDEVYSDVEEVIKKWWSELIERRSI